jgi:ParB/RepB/Spo0J family partition protein
MSDLENSLAETVSEKDKHYDGLRTIDLDIFTLDWSKNRKRQDDKIKEYAKSINENGLKKPLIVHHTEDGKLEIVDGHHRYEACRQLQKEGKSFGWIKYEIDDTITDESRDILMLIANDSAELSPIDRSVIFARLVAKGWKVKQIVLKTGFNVRTVQNDLRLSQAPQEVKNMIEEGTLSTAFLYDLMEVEDDRAKAENRTPRFDDIVKIIRKMRAAVGEGERLSHQKVAKAGFEVKHSRFWKKMDSCLEIAKKNEEPKVVCDLLHDIKKIGEKAQTDPDAAIAMLKKKFIEAKPVEAAV